MEGGRTPILGPRKSLASYAAHHASMVIFLSSGMLEKVQRELVTRRLRGKYAGSHRVQSFLAGAKSTALHGRNPGSHG
jgi:hypothetical protein